MASAPATYQRILFTGATGFVGHYLAPALVEAFPDARRLILRRPGDLVARAGWEAFDADLLDGAAIDAALAAFRPDLILHLAAQASVGDSAGAAEATWRINLGGALAMGAACARHAPEAMFFFVSSAEVYGLSFRDGPAREETPLRPANAYARSKAAAEAMLADVLAAPTRLLIARPFNHIGPMQDERFALPSFAAQIAAIEAGRRSPRLEVGNLDVARDFLDVRDVCAAYVALLRRADELPRRALFNVASGEARTLRALLAMLSAMSSREFDVSVSPARLRESDIPVAVGVSDKLAAATGWAPRIALEETLRGLLGHWREAITNR